MPTVPRNLGYDPQAEGGAGLMSANRPDASSILMAASLMHGMGRLGQGAAPAGGGGGATIRTPRKGRSPKGTGVGRSLIA